MLKQIFLSAALMCFAIPSATFAADSADKATGGSLSHGDMKFVNDAAQGGMAEVQAGQIAADKATDPAIKSFGQKMVEDHGKANDQLKEWAQGKNIMMPTQLDSSHQKMIDKLNKLSGEDFDKQYVKDMVSDHKDDVSEFQKFAERGDDQSLKDWAGKTLPTLQMHLAMIQEIHDKMK